MSQRFYVVLGVSPGSDLQRIKSAYRDLIRLFDPSAKVPSPPPRTEGGEEGEDAKAGEAPLVIERSGRPAAVARGDTVERSPDGPTSELDDYLSGWVPGFFETGRQAPRRKDLYVELVLAPSEARAGGMIPLKIPVQHRCAECSGVQPAGQATCQACDGKGYTLDYHAIEVSVPPGVVDGTRVKIDLSDVGLPQADLHVLVTVE